MRIHFVVVALLVLGCGGCGKKEPNLAEVQGTLTLGGKPFPGALVCFIPNYEAGSLGPRSTAVTDEKGHYDLVCDYAQKRGALAGKHAVVIYHAHPRFAGKYMTPWKTPLHADVAPGGAQVIDFDLEAAPPSGGGAMP